VFAGLILVAGDQLHYLVLLLIAHVIAVLTAFVLHRTVVFRVRGSVWRDLRRFWSVYLVGLAANLVLLPAGVELLSWPPLLAQVAILSITAVASYVAHARFSFARKAPEPEHSARLSRAPNDTGLADRARHP